VCAEKGTPSPPDPAGVSRGDALWLRMTDVFMPRGRSYDLDYTRRLRTAIGVGYTVIPVTSLLALLEFNHFRGVFGDLLFSMYLGSIPFSLLCMAHLRASGRLEPACHMMLAYFAALFVAGGYFLGGCTSPILYSVLSIPLAALLTIGRGASLIWLGAILAIFASFYALEARGYAFPLEGTQAERDQFWLASTWTIIAFVVSLVGTFERGRMQAVATLEEANRDLEVARRTADAANASQTAFLTNMSHELRTPLTAVLGFADIAAEQALETSADAEDQRGLGVIQRNARNLLKILNDMLDLSKIEAGSIEIRPAPARLAELTEHVVGLLRGQAQNRNTALLVEYAPGVPEVIEVDALRLQQILVNLVGNAIKFSFEGEVRVRVSAPIGEQGASVIRLEVSDSGIGMTPEQMAGIFEPFSQAEGSTTTRLYGGTGLGLSISRVLVELLGGEIGVESQPGVGSTFRVDLPVVAPRSAARPAPAASPAPTEATAAAPAAAADDQPLRCRVLVVDDLHDNRRLVSHFLKRAGADVSVADGGEEALRLFRVSEISGQPYDVVVMDIQMPRMDGYASLRALRERGCRAPIIALTAHAMATERERCLAAGFSDYASKPIDRASLLAFVRRNLERGAVEAPRSAPERTAPRAAARPVSRLRSGFDAVIDAVVPPAERGQPSARQRAQTLLILALSPLPVLPLEAWVVHSALPGEIADRMTLLVLLAIPLSALLPIVYRWSGSLLLAASGIYAYATAVITGLTYYNGGTGAAVAAWHVLVPMSAMAVLGMRAATFWVLVSFAVNASFWVSTLLGVSPRNYVGPDVEAFAVTMSNVGLSLLAAVSGLVHERAKVDAVDTLASANRWLQDARQHAERAGRAKSTFLANISHELRTPLTAILGFADLLIARARESEPLRRSAEALLTIRRSGQQLLETINDLLDLAKIESGSLGIESIVFDPAQLLVDTLEPLRPRAQAKSLTLAVELETPIPRHVSGDPTRLAQVLVNLVGNAIKFTEQGEVRVAVRAEPRGTGDRLIFSVSDTGCGIPAEHLPRLFTPFHQIDDSATREHGGSGLGLALCRRLMHLLGGEIEVASTLGQGSRFAIQLPLRAAPGSSQHTQLPEPSHGNARARRSLDVRLLLAEDGPDNQRLIARVLRDAGARVDIVDNGQLAVEHVLGAMARGTAPDVVLMDMEMPVLDGLRATATLRHAGYDGPILALTAHSLADERARCLAAGCDDIATKPIDWPLLLAQIARLADKPRL
jgi:signal transduction histidine kinase/DNA-binding response OmpR family regulator